MTFSWWPIARIVGPLALLAVLVGLVLWFAWDADSAKKDLELAKTEITNLEEANADYEEVIRVQAEAARDNDELILELSKSNAEIARRIRETRVEIREVKRNDPPSQNVLDTPLSDGLRGVLRRQYLEPAGDDIGPPAS